MASMHSDDYPSADLEELQRVKQQFDAARSAFNHWLETRYYEKEDADDENDLNDAVADAGDAFLTLEDALVDIAKYYYPHSKIDVEDDQEE